MATFTWIPDRGAKETSKPRKKVAFFGDGYEHRIAYGLFRDLKVWTLTFNERNNTEREAIAAFLEARGGVEAFDWVPPRGVSGKYVCEDWDIVVRCGFSDIPLTFRQVPA